jgi:hypothetical protein
MGDGAMKFKRMPATTTAAGQNVAIIVPAA